MVAFRSAKECGMQNTLSRSERRPCISRNHGEIVGESETGHQLSVAQW